MGVQDRDWFCEERRRREKLHYNPKSYRQQSIASLPGRTFRGLSRRPFKTALLIGLVMTGIVLLGAQWRRYDIAARQEAEVAEKEQKVRLQAATRGQRVFADQRSRLDRLRQEEANRARVAATQREAGSRAQASFADRERRDKEKWDRFYKPDPNCERSMTVECANAYIRARQKFNESASAGRR